MPDVGELQRTLLMMAWLGAQFILLFGAKFAVPIAQSMGHRTSSIESDVIYVTTAFLPLQLAQAALHCLG